MNTPAPPADPTQALLTQIACRDTVERAAHLADLPDPAGLAALFTEDAVLQRPSGDTLVGRAAIQAAYAARPAQRITRHLVAGTVVTLRADGEAHALSSVLLCSGSLDDPPGPQGRTMRGPPVVGEFDDLLRREADGCWRIARRTARFLLHGAG